MNIILRTQILRNHLTIGFLFVALLGFFLGRPGEAAAQATGDGLYLYGIQSNDTPQSKAYVNSSNAFSATSTTIAGTSSIHTILKASPTSTEMVAATVSSTGNLQVMCFDGTTWSNEWTAALGGSTTTRRFDVSYETATGDVVVLYSTGTSTADELAYRTKAGSSACGGGNWSSESTLNPVRTSGVVQWVKMASDPRATSSLITAIWADANSDLSAMVWSGSSWGNEHTAALETALEVVSTAQDVESFDVEYESVSGDVMVVWGSGGTNGTNGAYYAVCTGGTSSCTWGSVRTAMPSFLDDATNLDLAADSASDKMVFASIGNAGSDLQYGVWSGTAWTNTANADITATAPIAGSQMVAAGWLNNGDANRAVVSYYDSTATNIGWYTLNGTTWTAETDVTPTTSFGTQRQYKIVVNPMVAGELMLTVANSGRQAFAKRLTMNGSGSFSWSEPDSGLLVSGLASDRYRSGDFAYWYEVPPSVSISGVLYLSDRTTAASAGAAIKLAIGTSSTPAVFSATTTSGGVWGFNMSQSVVTAATSGTPYVIWLDGSSTKATTLLSGNASNSAQDIRLYEGYLAINGSTTVDAVNLANFTFYDSTDDTDVLYTISGTAATTTADFYIRQGNFTPVVTFAIGGNYINDGTFTHGSGTVQFNSTSSAQSLSGTLTGSSAFYDIEFSSSASTSNNLLAYWTFDEADQVWTSSTTGTTTDVSGNGNHGGFVNMSSSTSLVTGYLGDAVYFDGSNAAIRVPPGSMNGLSTSSVCVWIKPEAQADSYGNIFSTYNSSNATAGWEIYVSNDGVDLGIGASFYSDGSYHTKSVASTIPTDGTWTHVCARLGSVTGTINLYKNGVDIGGSTSGAGNRLSDSGYGAYIGSFDSVTTYNYKGTIDELQIYGSYLTDAEVAAIYENGVLSGTKSFLTNASTTHFTVNQGTVAIPTQLTVAGDFTNLGTLEAATSTVTLSGTSDQTLTGNLAATSTFYNLVFAGSGTKTFVPTTASTTNFTTVSGSGEVILPEAITVSGEYLTQGTTTHTGAQWVAQSASQNNTWNSVTFGEGLFVAVANSGTNRVMTSPDGKTWTNRTAAEQNTWDGVTYGNGRFVAVSVDGTNRVMYSDNGTTWSTTTAAAANSWHAVTYGNGKFVAVSYDGTNRVMYSTDGVTWATTTAASETNQWVGVTYGNGKFVAVSYDGTSQVMTSPDGITWTLQSTPLAATWQSVTYGNGLFVAVNDDIGTESVMTSPDGVTWTEYSVVGDNDYWRSVTYGNGLFVAIAAAYYGGSSASVMTSPDGIIWTERTVPEDDYFWTSVTYGAGTFVGVARTHIGIGTNYVLTADDTILYFTSSNAIASGTLTGASQLRDVRVSGGLTFASNASTTNLTIETASSSTLPAALSIAGNYTNNGTLHAGTGVVYLSGSYPQTFSGTMTATSSFNNLSLRNNSRIGTTTFDGALTLAGTLTAQGGTYVAMKSGATTTIANITFNGSSTAPVSLGATATGTAANFVLTGSASVSYTTIHDNNACGSTGGEIDVSSGNNTDGGNISCWNLVPPSTATVALPQNLHFYVGQATTTLGTITITDNTTPTITAVNDIRLSIASSTTDFRFDVGVTTLTFGGTASGKVANPVSYEDGGATLVISVSSDFSADDTLTIAGVQVGTFASVSTAVSYLAIHTDGSSVGAPASESTETIIITGSITLAEHDTGQADNEFSWQNKEGVPLYTFKLTPTSEQFTVNDLVLSLGGVQEMVEEDLTNLKLYIDGDSDGVYDAGETQVGGSGVFTLNGQFGAITFSSDFTATTARNYILIGDATTIAPGAMMVLSLDTTTGLTTTGVTSGYAAVALGSVSNLQQIRNTAGGRGGGVTDRIGGDPPAGAGVVTGGGSGGGNTLSQQTDGDNIAPDINFSRPSGTSTPSEWTDPQNAYLSDGTSATAATDVLRQTFINFGLNIPSGNTIQGISVKLDASGSTAAGTIDVALSWDGGSSYTTGKATPTLSGSDIVYTVGGPADTWGRSWSISEFSNANFRLRVTANTSSNTLRLDGLEIRIFHQATGGGSGGGGGI